MSSMVPRARRLRGRDSALAAASPAWPTTPGRCEACPSGRWCSCDPLVSCGWVTSGAKFAREPSRVLRGGGEGDGLLRRIALVEEERVRRIPQRRDPARPLVRRPAERVFEIAFEHLERRLAPAARVVRRERDEPHVIRELQ